MATYSRVSVKQSAVTNAKGEETQLTWYNIPPDHGDLVVRLSRPGFFARHPDGDVIFICRRGVTQSEQGQR